MARSKTKPKRRSHYEDRVEAKLKAGNIKFDYEADKVSYTIDHVYNPDWRVFREDGSSFIVETKGKFDPDDRRKMLAVKEQHPGLDIRMLFMRNNPIRKGSKTTYVDWCKKNGFECAVGEDIPADWMNE